MRFLTRESVNMDDIDVTFQINENFGDEQQQQSPPDEHFLRVSEKFAEW